MREKFDDWCYGRMKAGKGYDMFDVWQAAYAAGMTRAAEICEKEGTWIGTAEDCADAILAEIIKGE